MGKKDKKKVKSRNLPNTFENDGSFRIVCSSSIIKGFPGSVEEDLFSCNYRCRKWHLLFLVHWATLNKYSRRLDPLSWSRWGGGGGGGGLYIHSSLAWISILVVLCFEESAVFLSVFNPFLCWLSPFHLVLSHCFKPMSLVCTLPYLNRASDIDERWVEEGDLSCQYFKALHVRYWTRQLPPPSIVQLYVLLFFCFLAFWTVPIQLLYWHLQKFSVEYVMVKTKFQQEVTLPTLQCVWVAPYPCTQLHHLELVVYDFGSAHILVPSTNSHFFRPLRKKVLNLALVHN